MALTFPGSRPGDLSIYSLSSRASPSLPDKAPIIVDNLVDGQILEAQQSSTGFHKLPVTTQDSYLRRGRLLIRPAGHVLYGLPGHCSLLTERVSEALPTQIWRTIAYGSKLFKSFLRVLPRRASLARVPL